MSNSLFAVLFLTIGVFIQLSFWYFAIRSMRNHVEDWKESYITKDTRIVENLKIYFKNYDIFKKKKFSLPSTNILAEPLYNFNICDVYFNKETILLIGKMKIFGKRPGVNITVFNKNKRSSTGTTFKELKRTKTHLEIVFEDKHFEKEITAMIKIPSTYNIDNCIQYWV